MKPYILGVGLAIVFCTLSQVQGQACYEACLPSGAKCTNLHAAWKVQKAVVDKKKGSSCIYHYKKTNEDAPGTKYHCCETEEKYKELMETKRVNALLGDLTGAEIGEYPHQIQLVGGGGASCGGTIYNEEWIITAGHCIHYNKTVHTTIEKGYIIAGQTDVDDVRPEDKHYFQEIIVHEWYNEDKLSNGSDIALLHLRADSKLKFVKGRIQPLRVEPRDFEPEYGSKGLLMGFGVASEHGAANHLQEAEAPIHEPSKAARLSFDRLNADENQGGTTPLKQHLSVAGDDSGYTVGQGDSGGPVVCADEQSKPVLCGVASFKQCHVKKVCRRPSYFVRVAHHLDWIKRKTNGATQPKEWLVDEPMRPLKVAERDIPGYLVRITSETKSCMGTIIGTDRLITSKACIMDITGNDPDSINLKSNIYHYKSGRQLLVRGQLHNEKFEGNVSPKIKEYLKRPVAINDGYMLIITPEVGQEDVLQMPPPGYSINSPAVEYTMNEKAFSVETRRYLPMDRELCQQKANALDKNFKLHNSQLCMRRVYSAERECDRDIGGPLVCEGKYFCGQKTFHGCLLSAFPEFFNNHMDAEYADWLDDMVRATVG